MSLHQKASGIEFVWQFESDFEKGFETTMLLVKATGWEFETSFEKESLHQNASGIESAWQIESDFEMQLLIEKTKLMG